MEYQNKVVWNQRGASIEIDNSTNTEKIHISQRSGSNIELNNLVNSELATNNKQTNIVNDSYKTVGNDDLEYIAGDKTVRVGENSYELKGFSTQEQLNAFKEWKDTFQPMASINSEFRVLRGGNSYPNGTSIFQKGERDKNPVLKFKVLSVENEHKGYSGTPLRKSSVDDVMDYTKVIDRNPKPATERTIEESDISKSAGGSGSEAPGVLKYGPSKSAATENGKWEANPANDRLVEYIQTTQENLNLIEEKMGNGGDEITYQKRNKINVVGATLNDYPSIRIDPEGRSQPFEMLLSEKGVFKNHDAVPHIEEVDNSNFPGGEQTDIINNKWNVNVGSGGINQKTLGCWEMGGATLKQGFKKINISASHGLVLGSEEIIELQSIKSIVIRTGRQVYVGGSLGVGGNTILAGGAYVGGELFVEHITAPLEVHQTEDTTVFGKFATDEPDTLLIGYAHVGGMKYPVYAEPTDDLIVTYPHSHHHNGPAMRLTKKNSDVRKIAQNEGLNRHNYLVQPLAQLDEKKKGQSS
jgi:hypothetical protein